MWTFFFLGKQPVGDFAKGYPSHPGRFKYSPYRGLGHALMAAALRRGEIAECWFERQGKRVAFDVAKEDFVLGPPSSWYIEVRRIDETKDEDVGEPDEYASWSDLNDL